MNQILKGVAILIAIGLGAYGYWIFSHGDAPPTAGGPQLGPPAMVVEATEAIRATSVRKLKAIGTLVSNQSVTVSPEIEGRLAEIHFEDGMSVKKGALLASLDKSVLLAELADAEAALELAQRDFTRTQSLVKRGNTSRAKLDEADATLKSTQARLRLARARLEKSNIAAPFDGTLGIRATDIGAYLAPGSAIVNLEQTTPMKIDFQVPERFLTDLKTGKEVVLRSEAYPGETFAAWINAINPRVNDRTRSMEVQAVTENADHRLFPGQFVSVTIRVDERRNATFVPEQALVPNREAPYVFRVVDGKVEVAPVETGARIARHVEINAGVEPGDLIVTAGQQRLGPGAPVKTKKPTYVAPSPPDEEIQVIGAE